MKPPPVKFKDLEAVVDSNIEYNTLPFQVEVDYVKITDDSVLTGITVQLENKDLLFKQENGLHKAMVNIFGRITTVTRKVVTHFDDPVTIETTSERLQGEVNRRSIYNKALPLPPGHVPPAAGGQRRHRRNDEHATRSRCVFRNSTTRRWRTVR